MVQGFSRKKIKSKKILGEIFKDARKQKGVTLLEAEIATKVRAKYLDAIENSNWNVLPQEVYVRGFIIAYAKYLNIDKEKVFLLYESEAIVRCKGQKTEIAYNQSVSEKKVLITPKILAYFSLAIVVIVMVSYIAYQVVGFAGNPNLKIFTPENYSIAESDSVDLAGATDVDTMVIVNNENVPVTSDGAFSLKLKLHNGVNIIKIKAVNKAKKESSQVYTLEYKPKTASIDSALQQ